MSRAPLALVPGLLAAASVACGPSEPPVEPLDRPPVVLVLLDALHAAHLGHLGYHRPTTPHLDALAADGVSFANVLAPAPYTVASVPSLLTGRLPESHGVTGNGARLRDEEQTMAEVLGAAGYRTHAVVSQMNGGPQLGNDQGFEVFETLWKPDSVEDPGPIIERAGLSFRMSRASDFPPIVERVLADDDGRPLFLYLHVLQPHSPYDPPEPYRSTWLDPAYDGPFAAGDSQTLIRTLDPHAAHHQPASEADRRAVIDLYDANLLWADAMLGQVFDQLRAAGLYDEALIFVTSDHGEAFWQHGRWGHNDQLYDEMLRVPLIVKPPAGRGPTGLVRDELASLLDVLPTTCHWLGLPAPDFEPLDGLSLAPLFADPTWSPPARELLLRSHHDMPHVALRTDERKTIVERHAQTGETTRVERYELRDDPGEAADVWSDTRPDSDPVVQRLQQWIRDATASRADRDMPVSQGEAAMLEMLGYTQGERP